MTREHISLSKLNICVCMTVQFDDGSMVAIEGHYTVLFKCKSSKHQVLAGVYFIPWLASNIISLGQLNDGGNKVLIENGILRILD